MNRILVLYDSQSGNTAKMAKMVADGAASIPQTKVRIRSVDNVRARDVAWCDGLAVGSPTNMGTALVEDETVLGRNNAEHWMKVDGKIACAFSSAGGGAAGWNWPVNPS
jgi:NAD(P)H dehydrogenase (quinone)